MPATQKRISPEVNDSKDLPHKGRSELSKDEMRAAQFTPESDGEGLTRTPEQSRADAAPNEHVESDEAAKGDSRTQRASV